LSSEENLNLKLINARR